MRKIDLKRRHGLGACRFPCESGRNDHQCGWAITEDDNGDESREKTKLDKDKRDTWEKKILEMHKQKRIKEKKEAQKRLEKKSIDLDPTLSCNINVTA